jgi:hypothetical protein
VITVTTGHDLRLENLTVTGGQTGDAGGGVYLANGSNSRFDLGCSRQHFGYG